MNSRPAAAGAALTESAAASPSPPLCVDLDGTLTPVDTLHEMLLALVRQAPAALLSLPLWLSGGKARLKREVATRIRFDAAQLPLNMQLLEWLKAEHERGRRLVLATAADSLVAEAIAVRVGLFDDVIASDGKRNLSAGTKRAALIERFGERGFDYVGNEPADEPVWQASRKAIVVGSPRQVERARRIADVDRVFPAAAAGPTVWIKAMRLHQWVKNILIFLPAVLAHRILVPAVLLDCAAAFVAFGLCASSVYLVNDLLDLAADRQHPRKCRRAFASGTLSAKYGLAAAFFLLCGGAGLAAFVGWQFAAVLGGYYVLTWTYSLRLKRAALVDVMTLAGLYTIRIIAGAAATAIPLSFWLLAFSVFIFLSLGFVKRYTELDDARQSGKLSSHGRGYRATDLPLLMNLGIAAGYCTVVVMALYINSTDSQALYRHNKPLWLVCPLLLYWISRIWLLTTRGQMLDDPVVFALRDRLSLVVLALLGLVVLISI
jgi:4-hydroxybenzoate polyprenyltransferase